MQKFKVTGMSCAACSARVERAVRSVEGVSLCEVNLLTGDLRVEGGEAGEIVSAVTDAGYGIKERSEARDEAVVSENRQILKRLILSLILLLPLMYLSMGYVMWGFPLPAFLVKNPVFVAIAELILSAIVLAVNKKFFISGILAVKNLAPNMDTLVSLGSGASFLWSLYLTVDMIGEGAGAHALHGLYF